MNEIWGDIGCENDKKLLSDSPVGSTSMRNWGGFATLDCRSVIKVHSIASENH